jgi:hypothetical protein
MTRVPLNGAPALPSAPAAGVILVSAPRRHPRSSSCRRSGHASPSGIRRRERCRDAGDAVPLRGGRRRIRAEKPGGVQLRVALVCRLRAPACNRLGMHEPSALRRFGVHDRPFAGLLAVQLPSSRRDLLAAAPACTRPPVRLAHAPGRDAAALTSPIATPVSHPSRSSRPTCPVRAPACP